MENRNGNLRTLILMIAAALFVVAAIALAAFLGSRESGHQGIVLPPDGWQQPGSSEHATDEGFVAVTPENAPQLVEALQRPVYYHQTLQQKTVSNGSSEVQMTEIWSCDDVLKIVQTAGGQTKHILTDGETAYLWYRDESWRVETVSLPDGVTPDDLSGVLTYETIVTMDEDEILEAAYVPLTTQENAPCLYVAEENDAGIETRYWVDLASGLLTQAECLLEEKTVYTLEQTGLSILQQDDESLRQQMCLPDGTDPFSTASVKTPQE